MINVILFLYIIFCMILSIFNLQKGILLYIIYVFCVPFLEKNACGIPYNIIHLFFIIIFFLKKKSFVTEKSFRPLMPFLIYYFYVFITIFFQPVVPKEYSFNNFFSFLFLTFSIPFIQYNIFNSNHSRIMLKKIITFCVFLALFYGFILLFLHGRNPYIEELAPVIYDKSYATSALRLFGRVYGLFRHPMTFGFFIVCSVVFLQYIYRNDAKCKILLGLIVVNVFTCGVRTVLFSLFVVGVYLAYNLNNVKKYREQILAYIMLSFIFIVILVNINTSFEEYIGSIIGVANKYNDLQEGSNLSMRLTQLGGAFAEIKDHMFFGLGYDWTAYYFMDLDPWTKGHPIMLSFESIVLIILCNTGIVGLLAYIMFILFIFKMNDKYFMNKKIYLNELLIAYISYSLFTGEYGYLRYFLIFYVSIILIPLNNEKNYSILSTTVSSDSGK